MLTLVGCILLAQLALSQNPSPCPEIFSYEPRVREEDRWYGVISLQSREDLDGIWLKIILDRPAELLGNWFGEAVSSDNQEYTIKNPRYRLEAGPPVSVRFFVKYNLASTIPSLKSIRLNGKTVCTDTREEVTTTTPTLHISQIRPTGGSKPSQSRPGSGSQSTSLNNKEDNSHRPGSFGGSNHGGSNHRETTERQPTSSYENQGNSQETYNNNHRETSHETSSNNHREPSHETNNHSTNNRRPGSTQTNHNSNHRPESSNSGTNYNGLSAEEESSTNDSDFFPGDFAINRPTAKPASRPSSVSKRNVGCGTVAMRASPLISYGQNTTRGQWPWHAALYHTQGAQLMYTCGATLISENYILTAAHCVAKPQTNRPIDIGRLTVYLGKHSLKKFGSGTQDREVSEIFIHPHYNYSVYFNDIAVLKLKEAVDITNFVRPCCLWDDSVDIDPVLNKLGTVVGWGFDERRQISDTLMQAQMPVVSTVNCIYSNREFFSQFTFEKTYCAGFRNGTTVCNGDSGGGMVFPKSGTSGQNTVWQIRGIVSVGVALQGQGVCDPRHYIVFTDVAKHLDWIKQVMRE